jgi:hypothetical protein
LASFRQTERHASRGADAAPTAALISIQSLCTGPNPSSPANAEAARLYNENRPECVRRGLLEPDGTETLLLDSFGIV